MPVDDYWEVDSLIPEHTPLDPLILLYLPIDLTRIEIRLLRNQPLRQLLILIMYPLHQPTLSVIYTSCGKD